MEKNSNRHVFILCPPFCGSTILWRMLSTSGSVSHLPREGQFIPQAKPLMRGDDTWNPDKDIPWQQVREIYEQHWDQSKPYLLEKSPPNIITKRALEIEQHFSPAHFILLVRNPYAHCEGLMRRRGFTAKKSAEFTIECLAYQRENQKKLKNLTSINYEELVKSPLSVSEKIQQDLPLFTDIKHDASFKVHSIHGLVKRKIVDLNQEKINNLSNTSLREINSVLENEKELMEYWGYSYHHPSMRHLFAHIQTRTRLVLKKINKGFRH